MPYTCGNCGTDLTQYVIPKQGQVGTLILEGLTPGAPAPAPAAPFESVVVKCINVPGCGKSNAFEIAAKSDQDPVRGRLLDKEEEDLFAQLRSYGDPKSTAERINKYAVWLFGGTALLSPVLSLFTRDIPYTSAGKVLLALAVLSLVGSMVFATRASSLTAQSANPNNLQAMLAKVTERRTEQGRQLRWAAWCFAGALGGIGLIPLANMVFPDDKPPAEHVRYSFQDGKLSLGIVTADLDAPRAYVLDVSQKGSAPRMLARSRVVLDAASPTAELKVEKAIDLSQGDLSLVVARDEKGRLVSLLEQQITDKAIELSPAQAHNK
jgi:hypothetical protein